MADSIHGKILEAAVTVIQGLDLTGIADADIKQVWVPSKTKQWCPTLPAIHVSPFGTESVTEANNAEDEYVYPVFVAIMDNGNKGNQTEIDARLLWREAIIKAFNHKTMTLTGATILDQTVSPQAIADRSAWGVNLWASLLRVDVTVRKLRT